MILRFLLAVLIAGAAALWFLGEPGPSDLPGGKQAQEIEANLREMSRAVNSIQSRSHQAGARSRAEIEQSAKTLQTRIQATEKRLQELRQAPATSALRDRLTRALRKIKSWLVKKRS